MGQTNLFCLAHVWTVWTTFGLIINLVANLIFTPIQFGWRNLALAAVDILVVWAIIIWMMLAIWKHYRWVALAQVPYFTWVSIATVLQLSITWMNWGKSASLVPSLVEFLNAAATDREHLATDPS